MMRRAKNRQQMCIRDRSSPVKTIYRAEWLQKEQGELEFCIEGNGFLYHMVRNIVWHLVEDVYKRQTLDKDAKLNMEIAIDKGLGYVPADKNKRPDQPIGMIPVDSIYSPITRVKFGVTDTRVGNVTNYDKLTLEVWTDGSVEPDEAISMASSIMIDYLKLFQTGTAASKMCIRDRS